MERSSGSAVHTGSPLSAARCDDLIGKIDLASLWAATPDIAVNGTASREEVASLRFDERRRRPGTAACWDPGQRGEGERYFSRAALGADCQCQLVPSRQHVLARKRRAGDGAAEPGASRLYAVNQAAVHEQLAHRSRRPTAHRPLQAARARVRVGVVQYLAVVAERGAPMEHVPQLRMARVCRTR